MVVDPQPHMTYQPFLPEAAAGNISPRHTVVPLRRELRRCRVLSGEVIRIEHADRVRHRRADRRPAGRGRRTTRSWWCRARCRAPCRSRGCGRTRSGSRPSARRSGCATTCSTGSTWRLPQWTSRPVARALTFVFVGGGYAGIEALAEMEDMARDALRYYDELRPDDMRWVLVEATQRVLPEVDPDMGAYTVEQLRTGASTSGWTPGWSPVWTVSSRLSDGDSFEADTIVWTAGVKPSPMLARNRLPARRPGPGHLPARRCRWSAPTASVVAGAWSAGDCAAVPDLTSPVPGALCSPSAQHAVRQASTLADNIRRRASRPAAARTTRTSTSARWPASACTRAWPRSTASRSTAFRPGSCTARTM